MGVGCANQLNATQLAMNEQLTVMQQQIALLLQRLPPLPAAADASASNVQPVGSNAQIS